MAIRQSESDPATDPAPVVHDVWEDSPGCMPHIPVELPAKRPPAAAPADAGLRLGENGSLPPAQEDEGEEADEGFHVEYFGTAVVRLDPVEPQPPEWPRTPVHFQARPARSGRKGDVSMHWGRAQRHPPYWLVGAGMLVAGMVVGAVTMLPSINQSNAGRPGPLELVLVGEDQVEGAEGLAAMYDRQTEAERLFAAYATASSVERRLTLVRDAPAVEPLLRAADAAPLAPAGWQPPGDASWDVRETVYGGRVYGLLRGSLPDHSSFSAYFVKVWGELLLDWKATTAYGTASFSDLESGRGDSSEIRGLIKAGDYYHQMLPEDGFRCFHFVSPAEQEAIWCYVPRGGEVEASVDRVLGTGRIVEATTVPQKVTLRLTRPPDGCQPNQWMIGELLHKDWISP